MPGRTAADSFVGEAGRAAFEAIVRFATVADVEDPEPVFAGVEALADDLAATWFDDALFVDFVEFVAAFDLA